MQTRDDLIDRLTEWLGNDANRNDGQMLFDWLNGDGLILIDEATGYSVADGLDVVAYYTECVERAG